MTSKKLDFEWFSNAMTYLAETMAVEMTKIRIVSYYEEFEDYRQDIMEYAFKDCRAKCKFFPQVAEILEYYEQNYEYDRRYREAEKQQEQKQIVGNQPKADPVLAKKAMALIWDVWGWDPVKKEDKEKLTKEEAYNRCLDMNKEYPGIGWMDTAMTFRIKMDEEEVAF